MPPICTLCLVRGETAAHGAGQEAAVARRAWTALRQAAGDAERDGDWEANADGVGHVLTTRDGLLAKDQISQVTCALCLQQRCYSKVYLSAVANSQLKVFSSVSLSVPED